jgi:hypothetical protein
MHLAESIVESAFHISGQCVKVVNAGTTGLGKVLDGVKPQPF